VRVVGVDLGRRRIGVAVSDPTATLATPWRVVDGRGGVPRVASRLAGVLAEIAAGEPGLSRVVVGLPVHLDGRPHDEAPRAREIAWALGQRLGVPVTLRDERLTSVEAEQRLARSGRDWRTRKTRLDAAAAAVILQEYLDERSQETGRD